MYVCIYMYIIYFSIYFSILTETHINSYQIYSIRNNSLDPIFFYSGDDHTKGLLALLHLGLGWHWSKAEVCVLANERCLCVYASLGHNTRELLTMVHFFEGLQNYVEKKWGKKTKIILGDFICTIDKMDRDGRNKHKDFTDLVHIMPCQNYR